MDQKNFVVWGGCCLLFCAGAVWGNIWPKANFFQFNDFHDLAETVAAITTILAVVFGFTAWKKQFREQANHDLAKRALLEAERLKSHTLIMARISRTCANSKLTFADGGFYEQVLRSLNSELTKSDEFRAGLDSVLIEVEVIWGAELRGHYSGLYELLNKCRYCVQRHLEFLEDPEYQPGAVNYHIEWVSTQLVEGGWNGNTVEVRAAMDSLTSQATTYLQSKLVN